MKKVIATLVFVIGVTTVFAQSSVAHVFSQRILDTMPSRKAAMKEIGDYERRMMKELQETYVKLEAEFNEFEQNGSSLSPTMRKFEQERLQKRAQEFEMRQQEVEQQLQVMSAELNEPILSRVREAIKTVSKLEKVDYVLDASGLLYANGKDLTNKVIVEVLKMEEKVLIAPPAEDNK
jgi:outer membrane protein